MVKERVFDRMRMTRGKLAMVMVGLMGSILLLIGACGGTSQAATPTSTLGPTAPSDEPLGTIGGPDVSGVGGGPSSGPSAIASVETSVRTDPVVVAQVIPSLVGQQQVGIWVTGRGEVSTAPDLVILDAGVEVTSLSVATASAQAAQAMDQIIQALNARGILGPDIQTRSFRISPEFRWNELKRQQELVGYRVNNQISVKIRDVDSVGAVIDEVANAGGDLTRIQGVRFTVEDTKALESQAREKAFADLMAKAQQYANLAGVLLGKPVFISEAGGSVPRVQPFAQLAFAEGAPAPAFATPISGGELDVVVTVQGVFSIE